MTTYVFPGQGSQKVGMGGELFAAFPDLVSAADAILGYSVADLCASDDGRLNQTHYTQPALYVVNALSYLQKLQADDIKPHYVAGHSLGEYSALVASESIDYETAVALVGKRASLMQQAVPEGKGGMAAILGLEAAEVVEGCAKAANGQVVEAVNFNSPEQTVIGGESDAVDRAMEVLSEMWAKRAIKLAMSVPSHCSLLKGISVEMAGALNAASFSEAVIPVLHNVSADVCSDVGFTRETVAEQLYKPVRWVETIQALESRGADTIIEFGPGKVLFGLNRRINRKLGNLTINDMKSLEKALTAAKG